jgi:hypothetical protein
MPCKFRKNMCMDSKNCTHFKFLANIGEIFQTQCVCGNTMPTMLRVFGGYSNYCDECREKDRMIREDLAWRDYKKCRFCDFFIRVPEQIGKLIEPQGICIIKGDEDDNEPFHPYLSTSFSKKCECFSFNYDNFKTALFERNRWNNWNKWLQENMWKMATGKFKSMQEYYTVVHTKTPHPETGEAIDVGDSGYRS